MVCQVVEEKKKVFQGVGLLELGLLLGLLLRLDVPAGLRLFGFRETGLDFPRAFGLGLREDEDENEGDLLRCLGGERERRPLTGLCRLPP